MIASKVTFSRETQAALLNPALDFKKKRELRINRVKEFVREHPAGHKFRMMDLIAAAGYNPDNPGNYASGFGFITALNKRGIINIEKTKQYGKEVTIPGDENIVKEGRQTIAEIRAEEAAKEAKETETPVNEPDNSVELDKPEVVTFTRLEYQVVDVEEVRRIENLAREFSWNNDSDSLREFIKSLK